MLPKKIVSAFCFLIIFKKDLVATLAGKGGPLRGEMGPPSWPGGPSSWPGGGEIGPSSWPGGGEIGPPGWPGQKGQRGKRVGAQLDHHSRREYQFLQPFLLNKNVFV
jgi:hypothetical protein